MTKVIMANPPVNNRVVIVDDDPGILKSLTRLLHQDDYQLHCFTRPYDALQLIKDVEIGVIIADQCMPQLEGADFLHQVAGYQPSAVKIILSGYYNDHSITPLMERSQAWRYLAKPWHDEELRSTVAEGLLLYNALPE